MQKPRKINLISFVIPAYKQQSTIVRDLENIIEVLGGLPYKHEIILVVDGKLDKTAELAREIKSQHVQVFEYEKNQGKGYAVRFGVMKATGDLIGFIDAGMDINPSVINLMIDLMNWNNADIVVGSKLHPESHVDYPIFRRILSWGYRTLTHLMFGFKVRDTQVGLKIFRKNVAKDVFSRIVIKRFAFDIEVLAVAYKLGYTNIVESPVKLNFTGVSSITSKSFWRIILWMLWDTFAVFYRINVLHYYDKMHE